MKTLDSMNPEALQLRLAQEQPKPNPSEPHELIWYGDFGDRTVASVIWHRLGTTEERIRTYAQLALNSEQDLLNCGLLKDEVPIVANLLIKKGFSLQVRNGDVS